MMIMWFFMRFFAGVISVRIIDKKNSMYVY
jgi:hypothetical protein